MQQFSQSYPPCFRQHFSDQITHQPTPNHRNKPEEDVDPIPLIDLCQIDLKNLEQACIDWGIFRVVNHGIPVNLLSEVHEHAAKVFELEFESKRKLFESIPTSVMSYFWGTPATTPAGVALALYKDEGRVNYNWVEGLNIPVAQSSLVHHLHNHPLIRDFRLVLFLI